MDAVRLSQMEHSGHSGQAYKQYLPGTKVERRRRDIYRVGLTSRSDLIDLIQTKAKTGIYLTILGFGMGNYQNGTLK